MGWATNPTPGVLRKSSLAIGRTTWEAVGLDSGSKGSPVWLNEGLSFTGDTTGSRAHGPGDLLQDLDLKTG